MSVVVPVRNEAQNVGPLVDEIAAALNGRWPFEVVYVNDGSSDDTEAELTRLQGTRPWLRQIRHAVSCGQSAAVRTGVAAARAPIVATLDGKRVEARFADGIIRIAAPRGRHALVLTVADYQETKNTEDVPPILPNTTTLRATVNVR